MKIELMIDDYPKSDPTNKTQMDKVGRIKRKSYECDDLDIDMINSTNKLDIDRCILNDIQLTSESVIDKLIKF